MLVSITDFRGELKYPFSKILEYEWPDNVVFNLNKRASLTFKMYTVAPLLEARLPSRDLLRFPYKGGRYSLYLLIPTKATFLETVENLNMKEWVGMQKEMREEILDIGVVPFTFKGTSYHIPSDTPSTETGEKLPGVEDCVSGNLYKMNSLNTISMGYYAFGWNGTDREPYYFGDIDGFAFPKVIKELKEAEAKKYGGDQPVRYVVKRSFLFFLTDDVTGSIVLAGQVTDLQDHEIDWINFGGHYMTNEF